MNYFRQTASDARDEAKKQSFDYEKFEVLPEKVEPKAKKTKALSITSEPTAVRDKNSHRLAIIVPYRDSSSKTSQGGDRRENLARFVSKSVCLSSSCFSC